VKRVLVVAAVFFAFVLSGCASSKNDNAAGSCTSKNARAITQDFITNSKFDVDCATVKVGTPFYFVNNDDTTHTVTTDATDPEQFDAELPQKSSTYSHAFTKAGTYKISCKRHNETMTVIVTA
jgi:plastocyanin